MRYAIIIQELPNGEMFLYSNLKAAALDPCNPLEVGERRLHQLKKEEAEKQDERGELVTGYPFIVDMCRVDRLPVMSTKDVQESDRLDVTQEDIIDDLDYLEDVSDPNIF